MKPPATLGCVFTDNDTYTARIVHDCVYIVYVDLQSLTTCGLWLLKKHCVLARAYTGMFDMYMHVLV